MYQEKKQEETHEPPPPSPHTAKECGGSGGGGAGGFQFNVHAPEFVPRSAPPQAVPPQEVSGYFYPYLPYLGNIDYGIGVPDCFYFGDQDQVHFIPDTRTKSTGGQPKSSNDVVQKIVKQVEYQFSDTNLVASDFLLKLMNKDPEGYVPMTVIASWKKIKSLGVNNQMLIKALRTSSKLVVSDDGKKVRRKHLFTERDKEELQSRIVVVENLPEDYSRPNLEKIFNVVGRVKNIRICHPQEPNAARTPQSDVLISNKLHALVEYETPDQADKAVEKLNDERNWRKGLRVRSMLRRTPRSVIRSKRSEIDHVDMSSEDDQSPLSQTSPPSQSSASSPHTEQILEKNTEENQSTQKKGWGRGRTRSHGLMQSHSGRSLLSMSPQAGVVGQCENSGKLAPQGPRNPDGTRGFSAGRGKPMTPSLGGSLLTIASLPPIRL